MKIVQKQDHCGGTYIRAGLDGFEAEDLLSALQEALEYMHGPRYSKALEEFTSKLGEAI